MLTEDDLRSAIRERADLAPTARPELLAILPIERRTRRGTGIGIAVAAVTVVALAATPTLLRDHGGPAPAAQRSKPATGPVAQTAPLPTLLPARTWISYSGPDAVATHDSVEAQYIELRTVEGTGRDGIQLRLITAFAPRLFSTSLIKKPQPVTVNGTRGYFGTMLPWYADNLSHTDPAHPATGPSKWPYPMPVVVWKIGADQWAAVTSNISGEGTAAALTAIASRVKVTDVPVRTPIRIGYLPAGFKLGSVEYQPEPPDAVYYSSVGFRLEAQDLVDWMVTVAPAPKPGTQSGSPSSYPIYPVVHRTIGRYVVTVETYGKISEAEANKVLASVTIADRPGSPNDSWFTLAQALPR
jgi:hypothetical protein